MITKWILFLFLISGYLCDMILAEMMDPAEYFLIASHRPKLEILHPQNGEILDSNDLKIQISVGGYELPSSFQGSTICVALSTDVDISENCFEQMDLTFHVNGLSAGTHYVVKVVLYGTPRMFFNVYGFTSV
jgi:hypothetical protein